MQVITIFQNKILKEIFIKIKFISAIIPFMKKFFSSFPYFFAITFLITVFSVACKDQAISQSNNLKVKSHLDFDQKISGKAFVLDGDSLKVAKKDIRLFGIDAPEYSQTCFNKKNKEYACGQVSKEFLIKLVGGKKIECFYAIKDKYQRYLSKCYVNDISVNEELIKNGMAIIYNFTESDEKMDSLEKQAKTSEIGIWQGSFELPKNYRKKNPNLHKKNSF
jgi:endonuclease YncB( thermonuclease family)